VKLLDAELVETREFLPGQWLQSYHAPWLASSALPGQFVHVRTPDYSGLVLRRPFSINTYERKTGVVTIHFRITGVGTAWLARMKPGDKSEMLGPLGRPFEVDPRTRHVLLIAGGLGMAGVRSLADESLAANRQVTMLFGAASASEVYPSSLLPEEVEYIVSTDDGSFGHHGRVTELVTKFEGWADQAFACGPHPMLAALAGAAATRQRRLGVASLGPRKRTRNAPLGSAQARRRAWLQVSMEQNMGCAVGACLGCVMMGVDGPQRVCREGPVFASDEIVWEAGWRTSG
jgi:dihydroorotate dehydrogenase electron transfer subunit